MKTDHLKHIETYQGESILITILVAYAHYGENDLPKLKGVTEKEMLSNFRLDDYLGHLLPPRTKDNYVEIEEQLQDMMRKVYQGELKDAQEGYYKANLAFTATPEDEDYLSQTIIQLEFDSFDTLAKYLDELESEVIDYAQDASGDDTFFDYMPGYMDIFAQMCELLHEYDRYNKVIADLIENQDEECPFEFYRNTISPK